MKNEIVEAAARAAGTAAPVVATSLNLEGVFGNLFLGVLAGAFCAVAWSNGKETRRELAKVAAASVVLGCAITSLLTEFLRWKFDWNLEPKHVASFGVVVGWSLRYIVPPVIERIPKWIDAIRIPFFNKTKGE